MAGRRANRGAGSGASRRGPTLLERVLDIAGWQIVSPAKSAHLTDTFYSGPYSGPCEIRAESDTSYCVTIPGGQELVTTKECVKEVLS